MFLKIENQPKKIKQIFNPYKAKEVIICMENTGRYNQHLYEVLKGFSFKVFVVHPQHIKQSIGFVRGKNDKIDAKRICNFIIKNHEELELWKPNSQTVDTVKILMSESKTLINSRKRIKSQIKELQMLKASSTKALMRMKKADIIYLDKRITQIEQMIREVINQEEELKENTEFITSIPGVGEITAWLFIVKTNGFTRLRNPRKLGCFAGVVPFEHQSGTSVVSRSRVSKKADKDFKTVLHMAAMRAVRLTDNDFEKFYKRKLEEGKNPMSVLNAIRNKIIHVALALIKNKTFYQNRLVLS